MVQRVNQVVLVGLDQLCGCTAIGSLLEWSAVMNGRGGRVRPIVAAGDGHGPGRAVRRTSKCTPYQRRRRPSGPRPPRDDTGCLRPSPASPRARDLRADRPLRGRIRPLRQRGGIRAQVEERPATSPSPTYSARSVEKPVQAEAAHERPVGEQEIGGHRRQRELRAALTVLRFLLLTGAGPGRGSGLDAEARKDPAVQHEPADQQADDDEGGLHSPRPPPSPRRPPPASPRSGSPARAARPRSRPDR